MTDIPAKKRGRPHGSKDRKPRGHNTGPAIRGAFMRALKLLEENGKPLSQVWVELFEDDPATAMRLAISLMPKELDITTTDLTPEQWLEAMYEHKSESTGAANTVPRPVH